MGDGGVWGLPTTGFLDLPFVSWPPLTNFLGCIWKIGPPDFEHTKKNRNAIRHQKNQGAGWWDGISTKQLYFGPPMGGNGLMVMRLCDPHLVLVAQGAGLGAHASIALVG